ncbi:MAG: hypothetical protein DRG69_02490 [Deltaproteobacteria bacterium]|nr:MAG: hypothetical protein DRG69_02490 [Deltaproteobacteria bacterium]
MKVIVESNLHISTLFEPPMEVELEGDGSLQSLLARLNERCRSIRFLEGGSVGDDVHEIVVNGQDLFSLPQGLDTPLREGDRVKVEVYMDPLGGG